MFFLLKKYNKRALIIVLMIVLLLNFSINFSFADEDNQTRIYGKNRYETAIEIANAMTKTGMHSSIVVASGSDYPDALAGSYLAWAKGAPILLVSSNQEIEIKNYIQTHLKQKGKVYLLGGTGTVSSDFESSLKKVGITTVRLGGRNRYETNMKILKEAKVGTGQEVVLCSGGSYADSLSVSASGRPIILVGETFTQEQLTYLRKLKPSKIYIIGGKGAVNEGIQSVASGIAATERIGGADRYETSVNVAKKFFNQRTPKSVVLAAGSNFPDGLSGGPLALSLNSPILLMAEDPERNESARAFILEKEVEKIYGLGGPSVISDDVLKFATSKDEALQVPTTGGGGTAADMLKVMRSWLGYSESNGKYKKIIDIYNTAKPLPVGYKVKYTDAWCDACISAAAMVSGCESVIGLECGVGRHVEIFKRKGIWHQESSFKPKAGDIIVYNWNPTRYPNESSHIGIVEKISNGKITAIEGNYQGKVGRRTMPVGWVYIKGFARPKYAKTSNVANAANQAIDQLANAVTGN